MNEYENTRRLVYGEGATFVPQCVVCGLYVKPDKTISVNDIHGLVDKPNATCSKCGRTQMIFEGFY